MLMNKIMSVQDKTIQETRDNLADNMKTLNELLDEFNEFDINDATIKHVKTIKELEDELIRTL